MIKGIVSDRVFRDNCTEGNKKRSKDWKAEDIIRELREKLEIEMLIVLPKPVLVRSSVEQDSDIVRFNGSSFIVQ